MRKIIKLLLISVLIPFISNGQTASATYSSGDIWSNGQSQTNGFTTPCPGSLTVTIPVGAIITGTDVEYDVLAASGVYTLDAVSQVRCTSTGGTIESDITQTFTTESGTTHYSRPNEDIANAVTGGGDITFELHLGDVNGSTECQNTRITVPSGTWKVTVHYYENSTHNFTTLAKEYSSGSMTDTNVRINSYSTFHYVAQNLGSTTEKSPIKWSCIGGTPTSQTNDETSVLASLASENHIFTTQWLSPSVPGDYQLTIYTDLSNDEARANDTSTITIRVLDTIVPPIKEDFENGFTYFGNDTSAHPFVLTSTYHHKGNKSVFLDTYQDISHKDNLVQTKVMDLTGFTNPKLKFWHIAKVDYKSTSNYDTALVQISTDAGNTFTTLPASTYLGNSSDYATCKAFTQNSYSIWQTSDTPDNETWWKKETFSLKNYISKQTVIRFRFTTISKGPLKKYGWLIDDIQISDPLPYEDSIVVATGDSIFEKDSVDYIMTIHNIGTSSDTYNLSILNSGTFGYKLYNSTGTTEITQLGPISPNSSMQYIIRTTVPEGTANGTVDKEYFSIISQNDNKVADTVLIKTTGLSIVDAPYNQDFEGDFPELGWTNTGTKTWDKSDQTTAKSGTYFARFQCFTGNGTGYLTSPRINVTQSDTLITFYVNYYYESGSYGSIAELYTDIYDTKTKVWTNGTTNLISGQQGLGWKLDSIDLTQFEGVDFRNKLVQLRFRAISDRGSYNIGIDSVAFKNTLVDLKVVEVTPQAVSSGGTATPQILIANIGNYAISSYSVNVTDGVSYNSTKPISQTINPGDTTIINMDAWSPADGTYTLTGTLTCSSDEVSANNSNIQTSFVMSFTYPSKEIIGYNSLDGSSSGLEKHIVQISKVSGSMSDLNNLNPPHNIIAGEYTGGEVFGIEQNSNAVYMINGNGDSYKIGYIQGLNTITGMAVSQSNNAYISNFNGTKSTLYRIDLSFQTTLIGDIANINILGIASNNKGILFGIGDDNNLYKIDTLTGAGTIVGSLGVTLSGNQDIGFDKGNNTLFGTLYTDKGGLYTIDTTSGAATLSGLFTDRISMCAAITSEPISPTSSGTWATQIGNTNIYSIVNIASGIEITIPNTKASQECYDLNIQPGGMLTVEGTLNVNNTLTVESNSSGTGSLINKGTINVTNNTKIQEYLTTTTQTYNWHYLTSPLSSSTANVFPGVDPGTGTVYASLWDETSGTWNNITVGTNALTAGTGYAVPIPSNTTVEFSGSSLISGTQNASGLTYNSGTYQGYNLIGNPFTACFDASLLTGSNWTQDVWVRTDGNFESYNVAGGTGTLSGGIIPALQAFWVRVNTGGGSVSLDPANLVHNTATLYKDTKNNELQISVSNGELVDKTIIYFNENAKLEFENFDTEKRFADNTNYPQLFTLAGNTDVAINGINPLTKEEVVLPLGFKTEIAGTFTMGANNIEQFDNTYYAYLKDYVTNATIDLHKNPTYKFYSDVINSTNRFSIIISKSSTGIQSQIKSNNVYAVNKTIYIYNNKNEKTNMTIYDITGKQVVEKQLNLTEGLNSYKFNKSQGVYIVRLQNRTNTKSTKIIIK